MKMKIVALAGALLAATLSAHVALADDTQSQEDEKLLSDAKFSVTAEGMCEFFRKRTPNEADIKKVAPLVAKLGSDDFETREKASQALLELGPAIVPILRKEQDNPDAETQSRVRSCLEKLESGPTEEWSLAVARLMRQKKSPATLDVLLDYLPWVHSDEVESEVLVTLAALAVKDGKAQDSIVKAFKDALPARRAAAALMLARAGDADQKKLAQEALKDGNALVRFRAAQGLMASGDKSAIEPALALLEDAPVSVAEKVHEMLLRLGGDSSPGVALSDNKDDRKKCRSEWEAWTKKNLDKLDLASVDITASPSPAFVARETVRRFAEAGCKGDVEKLGKTLDDELNVMGIIKMKKDDLLAQMKNSPKTQQSSFGVIKSVKLEDVLATAPETKQFKEAFANEKIQAVSVEVTENGMTQKVVLVLRAKGGKMLVAGLAIMK